MTCPTPQKRRYVTPSVADRISNLWSFTRGDPTEIYACPCGYWHARNAAKAKARDRFTRTVTATHHGGRCADCNKPIPVGADIWWEPRVDGWICQPCTRRATTDEPIPPA